MGVGEVDEWMERQERRMVKKRERMERRKGRSEKYREVWKGVQEKVFLGGGAKPKSREDQEEIVEIIEVDETEERGGQPEARRRVPSPPPSLSHANEQSESASMNTAATIATTTQSSAPNPTDQSLWRRAVFASYTFVRRGYLGLRTAHILAARRQAEERVGIINEVYGPNANEATGSAGRQHHGWGLGSYAARQREGRDARDGVEEVTARRREESDSEDDAGQRKKDKLKGAPAAATDEGSGSSFWWWGPLRRWRLQDSTAY